MVEGEGGPRRASKKVVKDLAEEWFKGLDLH